MGKPGPSGDDVLRGLQSHAAELRGERYPGDVVSDLRARLGARHPRRAVPAVALWTAAAAALLVAAWLVRDPVPPPAPGLPSLPFRPAMSASVPALSSASPAMGPAMSLGVRAWARVRPPGTVSPSKPTTKEE